jgi:hypothetical protein
MRNDRSINETLFIFRISHYRLKISETWDLYIRQRKSDNSERDSNDTIPSLRSRHYRAGPFWYTGTRSPLFTQILTHFQSNTVTHPQLLIFKKKFRGLSPRANYTDRSWSAKLVPTFADRGYHAVSVTNPHGRNLGFLDRSRYFFFQVAPQLYSRG